MDELKEEELKCDACGMLYSEFLKTGIFGCPNCYIVFKARTVQIIKTKINNEKVAEKIFQKQRNTSPDINNSKELHIKIKELKRLLEIYESNGNFEMVEAVKNEIRRIEEDEIEIG